MYEILVRYGELALKSPSVRRYMEERLVNNIRIGLDKQGLSFTQVENRRDWGRILVFIPDDALPEKRQMESILEKIIRLLTAIPGIVSISPALRSAATIKDMQNVALQLAEKNISNNQTFAVRTRRVGNHDFGSLDVDRFVGGTIHNKLSKKRNLSVNLDEPNYTINIEIRDDIAFIFDQIIDGFGGLPQGTQGKIGSIFRGSLEDAVASFLLCKRGAITIPILFKFEIQQKYSANKSALEDQLQKFAFFHPQHNFLFYEVNFTKIFQQIGAENITCSVCDKVCIGIIDQLLRNKIQGIVLGNSTDAIRLRQPEKSFSDSNTPIYYPLIVLETQELKHPFTDLKGSFCLDNCPGYINQKKEKKKPLDKDQIASIIASAEIKQNTFNY